MSKTPLIIACARGSIKQSLEADVKLNFKDNYFTDTDGLFYRRGGDRHLFLLDVLDKNTALGSIISTGTGGKWSLCLLVPVCTMSDGDSAAFDWEEGAKLYRRLRKDVLEQAGPPYSLWGPWNLKRFEAAYPGKLPGIVLGGHVHCPHVIDGDDPLTIGDRDYNPSDADCTNDVPADPEP